MQLIRILLPAILCVGLLATGRSASNGETPPQDAPRFYRRVVTLCIGINEYQSKGITALTLAQADAELFAGIGKKYYGYTPDLLLGKDATKGAIERKLDAYGTQLGSEDALLVFFACHGDAFDCPKTENGIPIRSRVGYLIPYDADLDPTNKSNLQRWEAECLNMRTLVERIERMNAHHVVLIADACCSGFLTKRGSMEAPEAVNLLKNKSRTIMSATTQSELAHEGIFTKVLAARLKGYSDDGEAASITDVFQQLRPEVCRKKGGAMTPQISHVGDGDGEFLFLPLSIPEQSVALVKEAIQAATPDYDKLSAVRGVLDRARKRAGRKTDMATVIAAASAPNYWYGDDAAGKAEYWRGIRDNLLENAAWGDALAMAGLHYCYARGLGEKEEKPNHEEAYRYAHMAMDVSKPPGVGAFLLGRCYRRGIGVPKNEATAKVLYERSAEQGFVMANAGLADMILAGKPNAERVATARALLEEACAAKIPFAAHDLARAYADGKLPGIPQDIDKAVELFKTASDQGYQESTFCLYFLYAAALPGYPPKDVALAERYLRSAAASGFAGAQHALGLSLCSGPQIEHLLNLEKDDVQAKRWLELAARQKHPDALLYLASAHGSGVIPTFELNHEAARTYLETALKLGCREAYTLQGMWCLQNNGVYPHDMSKAFQCFQRAAQLGEPRGCAALGQMYENGLVPGFDPPKKAFTMHAYTHHAMHWYVQAIKNGGSDVAAKQLKEFRGDLNLQNIGIPYDAPAALWPRDVLSRWKRDFPESEREFERLYPAK
jgi:TPR repeat protein